MTQQLELLPTCHLHSEGAAVTSIFIGGQKGHLTNVRTPHFQQLQRVLVVIWHGHFIQAWFVGQGHSFPEDKHVWNQHQQTYRSSNKSFNLQMECQDFDILFFIVL